MVAVLPSTQTEQITTTAPYIYARTVAKMADWLRAFYQARDRGKVAYDVETTGVDPLSDSLVLVQLKVSSLPCLIIDCRAIPLSVVADHLRPILEGEEYLKIVHNLKFDLEFSMAHLGLGINRRFDTMLAERLLTAGLNQSASLKDTAFRRLSIELDKGLQTSFGAAGDFTHEQLLYAARDVDVLLPIMRQQVEALRDNEMLPVAQLEFDLLPVLAEAELAGVKIHRERWHNHITMLSEERAALEEELTRELTPYCHQWRKARHAETYHFYTRKLADYEASHSLREAAAAQYKEQLLEQGYAKGDAQKMLNAWKRENPSPKKPQLPVCGDGPINLGSPDQLQGAFDVMGVDLPRKASGALETDRAHLQMVADEWPVIEKLLRWREYDKLVNAFGENILAMLDANDRLHPDFNQLVSTGRLSCRKPNIQQIPGADKELGKEFRRSFVAPQGRLLVAADYSQIELRVLAQVSGDAGLIAAFNSGEDLHSQTASLMFGLPLEGLKENHPDKRKAAKTINFGIMYGLGPGGLAQQLNIQRNEAKAYIEMYYQAYPGVFKWMKEVREQGIQDLYSATMLGRRRFFPPLPKRPEKRFRNSPQWQGVEFGGLPPSQEAEYKRLRAAYERQLGNHVIQGTSADITKGAMVNIHRALHEGGYSAVIVMTVHDEIVVEVAQEQAEEVAALVVDTMRKAAERFLTRVPVEVSYAVGEHWEH